MKQANLEFYNSGIRTAHCYPIVINIMFSLIPSKQCHIVHCLGLVHTKNMGFHNNRYHNDNNDRASRVCAVFANQKLLLALDTLHILDLLLPAKQEHWLCDSPLPFPATLGNNVAPAAPHATYSAGLSGLNLGSLWSWGRPRGSIPIVGTAADDFHSRSPYAVGLRAPRGRFFSPLEVSAVREGRQVGGESPSWQAERLLRNAGRIQPQHRVQTVKPD